MVELEKIVGQEKTEEELEGEVIAGPSGEVVEPLSSGNTPFFLWNQVIPLVIQFHCCMGSLLFFSKTDPPDKNICLPDLPARSPLFIWGCLICR